MMSRAGSWATSSILASLLAAAPLAAVTADEVLTGMEKAGRGLKTFSAEFTQERVFVIAEDREERSGKFFYQAPGKMVWDFEKPSPRTVLIEPGRVSIYDPPLKQLQRRKLDETTSEFYIIGFGGTKKNITDKYEVELLDASTPAGGATIYHLKLTPRSIEESMFSKIELWVDGTSHLPAQFKFYEKTTDETTFRFTNSKVNQALPSSRFKIAPPPDTAIIE
ncbi:MAG: outer membrane lipoprotein carrier protein LolA [Acidobacteriota bacterium]